MIDYLKQFDIIGLVETWSSFNDEFDSFLSVIAILIVLGKDVITVLEIEVVYSWKKNMWLHI